MINIIDLLGFWTKDMVTRVHSEDEGIYFDHDGTGFITLSNPFVVTFDTFSWTLDNELLSVIGVKRLVFYHDALSEEYPSQVYAQNVAIERVNWGLMHDEEEYEALVFPKSSDIFPDQALGFICEDIRGLESYEDFLKYLTNSHW